MKNLLLVGELNQTVGSLNRFLGESFRTQLCTAAYDLVKGMVKVATPDIVVICLSIEEDLDVNILEYFRTMNVKIPVVLVGTTELCRKYQKYYGDGQFDYVDKPAVQSEILLKCTDMLSPSAKEVSESDDWGLSMEESIRHQILLVDDSPIALRSIKAMLDDDYDVMVATSGEKALELAKKKLPDLVLLDYEMPGWDGRRTLEELRNDSEVGDISVVFLTGVADKEHIAAVLGMSPQGYLLKPVEKDRLISTIQSVLGE